MYYPGNIHIMQNALQFIVGNIKKPKERFETILEPLQAVLQIGLLSFYPIGSKLAIHNNILTVQGPGYTQQVRRWYNNDKKEDVFYLYNVFSRFHKFYKHVLEDSNAAVGTGAVAGTAGTAGAGENRKLFLLLIELAKIGINNLTRTYNLTEKIHILHTLQMYKGMLDNPELVRRLSKAEEGGGGGAGGAGGGVGGGAGAEDDDDTKLPRRFPLKVRGSSESSPPHNPMPTTMSSSIPSVPIDSLVDNNIDTIFVKITDLYTQDDYTIIYHTLLKIQGDPQYYMNYVDGLNKILEPVNIRIKKWIDDIVANEWHPVNATRCPQDADFILVTDASRTGWGAVLLDMKTGMLNTHHGLWNRQWTGSKHSAWSEPEGITRALLAFFPNGTDRSITVLSDSSTAVGAFTKGRSMKFEVNSAMERAGNAFSIWNITFHHIPGELNVDADALSRQEQLGDIAEVTARVRCLLLGIPPEGGPYSESHLQNYIKGGDPLCIRHNICDQASPQRKGHGSNRNVGIGGCVYPSMC